MSVVAKFGGSSVANASQFIKIKQIILAHNQDVICVSAPKHHDTRITDLLFQIHEKPTRALFETIYRTFKTIQTDLKINYDLDGFFEFWKQKLFKHQLTKAEVVATGEYLTAKLLAVYLNYEFFDSKYLIYFLDEHQIDHQKTYQAIRTHLIPGVKYIVPGFYGQYHGKIKLFKRGGSDLTGALLAAGLKAKRYENWTDVNGVYASDPKYHQHAIFFERLSILELKTLILNGSTIYHLDAIEPLLQHQIPVCIRNTNAPKQAGTWISEDSETVVKPIEIKLVHG